MTQREILALSIEFDLGAVSGKAGEKTYLAETQDVCADGVKILTDYPLKTGAILRLSMPVSGPGIQIPVFAEVAWSVPSEDRFRAGLRFLK